MNDLATELLHKVAYSGWLRQSDILSLCCASQTISEKLLGDDYGKNYFKSLLGARACAQYKWWDAARYALLNGDTYTDVIGYLFFQAGNAWTLETRRLFNYLLKQGYVNKVSTEILTIVADWHSEPFKKLCLNQDFANITHSQIATAVKTRDIDFFRTFVDRMPTMKRKLTVKTFSSAIEAVCQTKHNEMVGAIYKEFSKFDFLVDEYFYNDIVYYDGVQVFKYAMTEFPKHCDEQLLWNAFASCHNPVFLSNVITWPGLTDRIVRTVIKRFCSQNETETFPLAQTQLLLTCSALDVRTPIDVSELQNASKQHIAAFEAFPFIYPQKRKRQDFEGKLTIKQKLLL